MTVLLIIFKIRYTCMVAGSSFLSVTDETFLFIDDIFITGLRFFFVFVFFLPFLRLFGGVPACQTGVPSKGVHCSRRVPGLGPVSQKPR